MANSDISERIKEAIKNSGGYEAVSLNTGINIRTLTELLLAHTDQKLTNFLAIAEATNTSIYYLIYGISDEEHLNNIPLQEEVRSIMSKLMEQLTEHD
ncbi:hypothetical protein P4S72_12525 [Vibrio sp. PP-XX7]